MALDALGRMYRPEQRLFGHCIRRQSGNRDELEGTSVRYTAMTLLGLMKESEDVAKSVMSGHSPQDVGQGLLDGVASRENLGDVALIYWTARDLGLSGAAKALDRLRMLDPVGGPHPTVEVAWALTALSVHEGGLADERLAADVAHRLLDSYHPLSGLFSHWPEGVKQSSLRSHVACFADLVYPIQALSHYGVTAESREALDAVQGCADRMCATQGSQGQWWWHFDVRTGRVIERFPVYAVHQDAMAPMALFAAGQARGTDYDASIERGLSWLIEPPEIDGSLIDTKARLIWRKVARREPGKLSRSLQAAASGLHSGLRVPCLDRLLRPDRIDFESRPYHMGWLLYAWAGDRGSRFLGGQPGGVADSESRILARSTSV